MSPTGRIGLYVHIPFCVRHCPYCDFAVVVSKAPPHEEYGAALLRELSARAHEFENRSLQTIYFGGGTPSMWSLRAFRSFMAGVAELVDLSEVSEITMELNPETASRRALESWVACGVNRLSLGVQSLRETTLQTLGRAHRADQVYSTLEVARELAIPHVSVDYIFGVPGTDLTSVSEELEAYARLVGVDHVSAYELTWEPKTAYSARASRGELVPWTEEELLTCSEFVIEHLERGGFRRYEVSNYARPAGESVHNSGYWAGHEYVGIGVGAHSLRVGVDVVRRWNFRHLGRYLDEPAKRFEQEALSRESHLAELVMMGARTRAGVNVNELERRCGCPLPGLRELLGSWVNRGWGSMSGARFVPGNEGLSMADSMASDAISTDCFTERGTCS